MPMNSLGILAAVTAIQELTPVILAGSARY